MYVKKEAGSKDTGKGCLSVWSCGISIGKARAVALERVQKGGIFFLVAITAEVIPTESINGQEDNIFSHNTYVESSLFKCGERKDYVF